MFTNLRRDLNAIIERDPAASKKWPNDFIIPEFPSDASLSIVTPYLEFWVQVYCTVMQMARILTGIEIHPLPK